MKPKKIIILLIILSVIFFRVDAQKKQNEFFVSPVGNDLSPGTREKPFSTIQKARNAVRLMNGKMNSDIIVYLREGLYNLSSALVFDNRDAGTNGYQVIYKAYHGEHAVICSSRNITGWTLFDNKKNIYKACAKKMVFRQLYVNNQRAVRARTPNIDNNLDMGPYFRMQRFENPNIILKASEFYPWKNLNQVEIVFDLVWTQYRQRIQSYTINGSEARINVCEPEKKLCYSSGNSSILIDNSPFYFENAYEFLDAEGEWYLDTSKDTVYYKPFSGEDMAKAIVSIPVADVLIKVRNIRNKNIINICFDGIRFEYCNYLKPSFQGYTDPQATLYDVGGKLPGGIEILNSSGICVTNCTIRHMGAQGILLDSMSENCRITGNKIYDISGCGIVQKGEGCSGNIISQNCVFSCGREFRSSQGIASQFASYSIIENNEVWNLAYTGISIGWEWNVKIVKACNNKLRFNNIHHVMQLLADGGGIYTLGKQPGTHIFENYIHDINKSHWCENLYQPTDAIEFDFGSSYLLCEHNVLENTGNEIICVGSHVYNIRLIKYGTDDKDVKVNSGPQKPYLDSFIAPSDLKSFILPGKKVMLKWNTMINNETGYVIERKQGVNGEWKLIDVLGPANDYYTDENVKPDLHYYYRIKTCNCGNNQSYSNITDVKVKDFSAFKRFGIKLILCLFFPGIIFVSLKKQKFFYYF